VAFFQSPLYDKVNAMPNNLLINVSELSKKLCAHPIQGKLAYATKENFLGRIVTGYHEEATHKYLLTRAVAEQLCYAQNFFLKQNVSLFIFDAFRPLRAVKDFANWSKEPLTHPYEEERKQIHYPHLEKQDLIRLGYILDTVSRHCFGNTVDLTLISLETNQELDMGTVFDYFDKNSHLDAILGKEVMNNRKLLLEGMKQFGFIPYAFEWWHFEHQICEVEEPMDISIS